MAVKRRKSTTYRLGDDRDVTPSQLRRLGRSKQIDAMRQWFYANYENPVESTPYESAEGGFIWGGPYDPREELDGEFGGIVPDDAINELAKDLWAIAAEWTKPAEPADLDDYFFDDIAGFSKHREAYHNSIDTIERLLATETEPSLKASFHRLLYVNVITALETYLSDFFISTITADRKLLRRFVETCDEFKTQKITISEVFRAAEEIEQKAGTYLVDLVWHRLDRVKPMFKSVLDVSFPSDLGGLFKAIFVRHDLVHRNGKKKDGTEHVLGEKDITEIPEMTETLSRRRWR